MATDFDLLIDLMVNDQKRGLLIERDLKEHAKSIGETKAIAMSVRKGPLRDKSCGDRYAHKPHLWWERDLEPGDHAYRCAGRSQDAT